MDIEKSFGTKTENSSGGVKGNTVLLVDDNDINRTITESILNGCGVKVLIAVDGEQALEIFEESEEGTIAVIFMDVIMPKMDGLEATEKIRKLNRSDATLVPIIAMTGNDFEDDVLKAKEAGMNDYLPKPVKPSVLRSTLAKYLM